MEKAVIPRKEEKRGCLRLVCWFWSAVGGHRKTVTSGSRGREERQVQSRHLSAPPAISSFIPASSPHSSEK